MEFASEPGVSGIPPLNRYSSLFDNKPKCSQSRPQTSPSFPNRRSKNPFFVRNAPHPGRVRHLKGFLDVPVCMVDDTVYQDLPTVRQKDNQITHRGFAKLKREKFLPGIGMVNTQPQWFEELQNFTDKVGLKHSQFINIAPFQNANDATQPEASSEIPRKSSSRLCSRQESRLSTSQGQNSIQKMENDFVRRQCSAAAVLASRKASGNVKNNKSEFEILTQPFRRQNMVGKNVVVDDKESLVFHLLTKVLKTEDEDEIKDWLMQASLKEKDSVLAMVRALSNTNEDERPQTEGQIEYDQNFLYHESSLSPGVYQQHTIQQRFTHTRNPMLEQIQESLDMDIDYKARSTSPLDEDRFGFLLPKISKEDSEIEEIRGRLMSRSSMSVFNT